MKELSGQRAWQHAYKKRLEESIEGLRDSLEISEGRTWEQYHYLCGQVRGIRIALDEMQEAQERYKLDDDAD